MSFILDVGFAGLFHAATLFMITAGLQLIFGVQRILNLAGGSVYAFGAYVGISVAAWALAAGVPLIVLPFFLIIAGMAAGLIGIPLERVIRNVYRRPDAFQLLLTFALVLMLQDAMWFIWGLEPKQLSNIAVQFGTFKILGTTFLNYNVMVIAAAIIIAASLWFFLERTKSGKILLATAENHETSAAMGINVQRIYKRVFLIGTMLATVGGALVIPTTAATLEMGVELAVEAFAVIVIGGLGSISGAVVGAIVIGLARATALVIFPEVEVLAIYAIVIAVLLWKPSGLFGRIGV